MTRRYEILVSLPAYGPLHTSISENGEPFYSEGFVVRFFREDGTDWIANFQLGIRDLNKVYELPDTSEILVIAGGTCYFMLPDQLRPLEVFGFDYTEVLALEDGRLILANGVGLTIIERNGECWSSERISWDGLKELSLDGSVVNGLSYDPTHDTDDWLPFTYNIDTKEMKGGSFSRR